MKARFALVALLLAGCATGTPSSGPARAPAGDLPPLGAAEDVGDSQVTPPITGVCGMEALQHYVGQPRVNVPRNAMPENYRVVGPDTPMTMDHRPDRLTIRVNSGDIVESMTCG